MDGVHEVDDKENTYYKYKFNVCGSIPKPLFVQNTTIPDSCIKDNHAPCIEFQDRNGTTTCSKLYSSTPVMVPSAVQIVSSPIMQRCYWLGLELDDVYNQTLPNYNTTLIDMDNSAAGIQHI